MSSGERVDPQQRLHVPATWIGARITELERALACPLVLWNCMNSSCTQHIHQALSGGVLGCTQAPLRPRSVSVTVKVAYF